MSVMTGREPAVYTWINTHLLLPVWFSRELEVYTWIHTPPLFLIQQSGEHVNTHTSSSLPDSAERWPREYTHLLSAWFSRAVYTWIHTLPPLCLIQQSGVHVNTHTSSSLPDSAERCTREYTHLLLSAWFSRAVYTWIHTPPPPLCLIQ